MNELAGRLIAHVVDADQGPAARWRPLLQAASHVGLQSVVLSSAGSSAEEWAAEGVAHVALSGTEASKRRSVDLVRLLRRLRPDIVHIHARRSGLVDRFAARAASVPGIVHTTRGLSDRAGATTWCRVMTAGVERLAIACSHLELVEHPFDLAALVRLRAPADRLVLIGTGVDLDRFRPRRTSADIAVARSLLGVDPGAVVVAVAGLDGETSGHADLMAVTERLAVMHPEVIFVVMDEAETATEPDQTVVGTAAPPGVHATGAALIDTKNTVHAGRSEHREMLHAGYDFVLIPDAGKRLSRSVMEAVASGLAVIAADSSAARRAVDDGGNGVVIPPRDIEAMIAAVVALARDPARRGMLGARSRARAEAAFDEQAVFASMLAAYRRLPAVAP